MNPRKKLGKHKFLGSAPSSTPGEILVQLKELMLRKLGITPPMLKAIIDKYVRQNTYITGPQTYYKRGNIFQQLTQSSMTILTLFKLFHVLDLRSVEITIKITTKVGTEAEVSKFVTFSQVDMREADED